VGVVDFFGHVGSRELQSGLQFKVPFARVIAISIQTQDYTMTSRSGEGQIKDDDSINALTKEGLTVNLDITVLYHIDGARATELYKTIGKDYESKILRPMTRSAIRGVVAQFDASALYSEKREEAGQKILADLKTELKARGIAIEDVLMRNVVLPQKLADAIEEKLRAEQEAERFDFVLKKEQKEAERKRIEAEGQRDAQKTINESLTAQYLQYLYIQGLKEREGTIYVPVNPENGLPLFKGL
jgi:regulator of protease activity HflC (stomatin/prohibitin superfamily)